MAPCNKCTPLTIALLVASAAVILQPSAASRVAGGALAMAIAAANDGAEDPGAAAAPSPGGGGIPQLPPQPRECRPWLARMTPCAGFLTNATVYAPEATCCDGFNAMFTLDTVTCLCHVVNGDIGQLLPVPMRHMRMVELFSVCGHDVRVDVFAAACNLMDGVPPIDLPSPSPLTPLPSPSPAPSPIPRWVGWP
ncbi:non-specific lipid-transfer protein C6 [Sorghum bicolor]|uniref:Bifunctional inhibitor/plant lipid transfer protein/seed storage helical domain-containing protein n=1 Tax=Sorghum bicolor TaxID=4558 RepID=A0A1B6QAX5_SORBI|nr:non-specific lipid-transfer protein C6 [Sorghum bicolor]KXG35079.1 hypothetical protein SORBI_3002G129800 [Sorghum bicolor]|eukprot:XP_002461958.2 non-specific lipid-transfer protein C6 [Sorghum bicolor]